MTLGTSVYLTVIAVAQQIQLACDANDDGFVNTRNEVVHGSEVRMSSWPANARPGAAGAPKRRKSPMSYLAHVAVQLSAAAAPLLPGDRGHLLPWALARFGTARG